MRTTARVVASIAMLVTLTVSGASPAQVLTPVAADRFRDLTMPFDARLVTYFFGAAKPPTGETVEVRARGTVLFHLYREAGQFSQGARVKVAIKRANGDELAKAMVELEPVTPFGFIKQIDLPADADSVSLSVVDDAEGGPTGHRPYTLILEAWPLSSTSAVDLTADSIAQDHGGPTANDRRASCRMVGVPSRRADYIEKFTSFDLSGLPDEVTVQRLVSAGGYLLLSPPSGLPNADSLKVRVRVKYSGDGPFVDVCPDTVLQGGSSQSLEAELPSQSAYSIWRIETTLFKPLPVSDKARLDLTRERVMTAPDPFRAEPGWNNSRGLICFDRVTQFQGVPQSANPFGGRTRLNIAVPASGSTPLSEAERSVAEAAVLQAASIWRYSCLACRADNLSVISVNGKIYVSDILFRLAGPPVTVFEPAPISAAKMEQQFVSFLGSSRVGIGPSFPYRKSDKPTDDFRRLCSLEATESDSPTVKRVQDALCTSTSSHSAAANIRVTFKAGETACGNDADIVGCRADNELTQYNIRDYRFVAQPSGVSIGRGSTEVDLLQVVLHEMGHWVGLGHLPDGESIMAPSLEQARCIDFETVKALAEQTFGRSDQAEKSGPQALTLHKRPASKRGS